MTQQLTQAATAGVNLVVSYFLEVDRLETLREKGGYQEKFARLASSESTEDQSSAAYDEIQKQEWISSTAKLAGRSIGAELQRLSDAKKIASDQLPRQTVVMKHMSALYENLHKKPGLFEAYKLFCRTWKQAVKDGDFDKFSGELSRLATMLLKAAVPAVASGPLAAIPAAVSVGFLVANTVAAKWVDHKDEKLKVGIKASGDETASLLQDSLSNFILLQAELPENKGYEKFLKSAAEAVKRARDPMVCRDIQSSVISVLDHAIGEKLGVHKDNVWNLKQQIKQIQVDLATARIHEKYATYYASSSSTGAISGIDHIDKMKKRGDMLGLYKEVLAKGSYIKFLEARQEVLVGLIQGVKPDYTPPVVKTGTSHKGHAEVTGLHKTKELTLKERLDRLSARSKHLGASAPEQVKEDSKAKSSVEDVEDIEEADDLAFALDFDVAKYEASIAKFQPAAENSSNTHKSKGARNKNNKNYAKLNNKEKEDKVTGSSSNSFHSGLRVSVDDQRKPDEETAITPTSNLNEGPISPTSSNSSGAEAGSNRRHSYSDQPVTIHKRTPQSPSEVNSTATTVSRGSNSRSGIPSSPGSSNLLSPRSQGDVSDNEDENQPKPGTYLNVNLNQENEEKKNGQPSKYLNGIAFFQAKPKINGKVVTLEEQNMIAAMASRRGIGEDEAKKYRIPAGPVGFITPVYEDQTTFDKVRVGAVMIVDVATVLAGAYFALDFYMQGNIEAAIGTAVGAAILTGLITYLGTPSSHVKHTVDDLNATLAEYRDQVAQKPDLQRGKGASDIVGVILDGGYQSSRPTGVS